VLGALVGGNVSLSAIDYNNLASAKVDLFGLANAVALQTGQVGGTYQQVFSGTVQLSALLTALANEQPGASSVLQQLAAQAALSGATVDLSRLIEYGPFSKLSLSEPEPNVSATASVLSILQAALQVGGASHLINLNIGASIPGLSTVTAEMSIGEPAQGTTVMAVDQVGTTVHTAQVRFYFNIGLVGVPPASLVNLPLYVEVGYGTATLAALSCNSPLDATTTTATLNVTPGLLYGIIGTVTPAQMTNFSAEPPGEALNANGTVSAAVPAPLVSLLGLPVLDGAAAAAVGNQTPTPVGFTYADIQNGTVKTTSTTDFVGSLITSVTQNLKLTAVGVPVPGLPGAVTATLTAAAGPLDTLLTDALQTAGVGVGSAATWVNGARCGAALLAG
jgi:uncharacterized membrane protein